MIKAVFFDAIDTLFRPYPDKIGMYCRIIKKTSGLSISREKMTEVWQETIEDTEKRAAQERDKNDPLAWDGFNQRILKLLNYQGDLEKTGERLLYESWSNPQNFRLFTDVQPTLEMLKQQQIIVGCISNEDKSLYNFFVQFNILKYFQLIILSEEERIEKPNSKIFKLALERVGLKPNETIHIGDSLYSDYKGALKAGLFALLIDRENKIGDNGNIVKIDNLIKLEGFL
jgi:REG-2-like HAD superfamily hydrolase